MTVGSFPMQRLSTQGMQHPARLAFVHEFVARQVGGLHLHPVDRDNIAMDLEAMTLPCSVTVGHALYPAMSGARTRDLTQDGRDNYLLTMQHSDSGLTKADLVPNINFFMNVPVTADGQLKFDDGVSGPGKYVELRAEMDLWVLVSNCPQLNNPCNAYNPTPVQFLIWG